MPYEPTGGPAGAPSNPASDPAAPDPFGRGLDERFFEDYRPGLTVEYGSYRVTSEEIVDFVPYLYSGNTIVTAVGDPKGLNGLANACGARVAAQTGTTVTDYLTETSAECESAGKPPVDVRLFGKDTEAFQQLSSGLVDAYGTTVETAAYALAQQPDKYQASGEAFGKIKTGIATAKGADGLHQGIAEALAAVRADGTYDAILAEWKLEADALPADGEASAEASATASATS